MEKNKCETLYRNEIMKIDYFFDENHNNQNLAYIFTPSMNRNLEGNAYGGEVFIRNGYDTIAFKISNDDWFQSIPVELFQLIVSINQKKGYVKRVSYGSSMGGYAAIALSKFLDCNISIVFSPQYSIDEEFDTRWMTYAKKINFKYRISKESVNEDCKFFIFYDNKDMDELQVRKLTNILPVDGTKLIKLPYAGHPAIHCLAEIGLIKSLLVNIVNEVGLEGMDFLSYKKTTKSYFQTLSINLLKKKHLKWALSAIESALKIDSKVAGFHSLKSGILDRMGKVNEAVISIKEAITLDPNNPHFFGNLSNLLLHKDLFEEALFAIESALKIDFKVAGFHRHKSGILDRMGKVNEAVISIKEAIALDPNNVHHLNHLRHLLNKQANI